MTPTPANALIAAMAAGRPEAFAALYDLLGPRLLRVAQAMLPGGEAEDAVQDVFVELVRRRGDLSRVLDLEAYVFAMLRHGVGRRLQRRQTEKRKLLQLTPVDQSSPPEQNEELEAALAALPAEQREIVALKIDGEMTFAQIAEMMRISPNTAASRYRYAMEKLRSALEESQ
jgi:RNA polymerase sigma-70 factor, ECF subfamily